MAFFLRIDSASVQNGVQINYSFGTSAPGVTPSKFGGWWPTKQAVKDFVTGMDGNYSIRDAMLANRIKAAVQADPTLTDLSAAVGQVSVSLP